MYEGGIVFEAVLLKSANVLTVERWIEFNTSPGTIPHDLVKSAVLTPRELAVGESNLGPGFGLKQSALGPGGFVGKAQP